ncbi:BcABA3 [Xylariaceae sp. FL0662B]|nr:BcABA3 [Xylariaceae sp. FL0662B]
MSPRFHDAWYYPPDIAHDLDGLDQFSEQRKQEVYACAWEYARCVIPQYTNWNRYVAFMRIMIIAIVAEFRGDLVDVAASDSALACNDLNDVWPTDEQFELLAEIADTLYDAVAFYKHRSDGETSSTFSYVPADLRIEAFRVAREVLWAVDVAYAHRPEGAPLMNFDLTIGRPETDAVVEQTRRNVKLWNRVDADVHHDKMESKVADAPDSCLDFSRVEASRVANDVSIVSYGARPNHCFGGVELCQGCQAMWRGYVESLPERTKEVFPEIVLKSSSIS